MIATMIDPGRERVVAALVMLLGLAAPAAAQGVPLAPQTGSEEPAQADTRQANNQNEGLVEAARTADTGIGEVGRRQTARDGPVMREPLDRIDSRINNRVQNRIRNRIDRYYDPTANAMSPFERAERETQTGPR